MNYTKMVLDMGISLGRLSDIQLNALIHAAAQEANFREQYRREKIAEEYTDKLDDLADEILEKGMVICYNGDPIDIREFSVNWKDD